MGQNLQGRWQHERSRGTTLEPRKDHEPAANCILDMINEGDRRKLQAVAFRYVGQEAEDIVHDAFVRALERGDSFRGDAAPTTWLHRVIVNACLDLLRHRHRSDHRLEIMHGAIDSELRSTTFEAVAVRRAFRTLSAGERRICVLHHIIGYTHREVATILGVPLGTTKSRLYQARKRLLSALGHKGDVCWPTGDTITVAGSGIATSATAV